MKTYFKSLTGSLPNFDCPVKADFPAPTLRMRASYVISVFWKDRRTSDHHQIGEEKVSMQLSGYLLLPCSELACARTRGCWPSTGKPISSKVSPDRKNCNCCVWNCWVPEIPQPRRVCLLLFFFFFSHCSFSKTSNPTWSFYIIN